MPDDLKVEQRDRDAAADSPHMVGLRAAIRAGKFDDNPVVQSFARHRTEASRHEVGLIVAWLRGRHADWSGERTFNGLADAIERGDHHAPF